MARKLKVVRLPFLILVFLCVCGGALAKMKLAYMYEYYAKDEIGVSQKGNLDVLLTLVGRNPKGGIGAFVKLSTPVRSAFKVRLEEDDHVVQVNPGLTYPTWIEPSTFHLPNWKLFGVLEILGLSREDADKIDAVVVTNDPKFQPDPNMSSQEDLFSRFGPTEGRVSLSPTVVTAGTMVQFDYAFTVGISGIKQGGGILLEVYGERWSIPQTTNPSAEGYLTCSNTGTRRAVIAKIIGSGHPHVQREHQILIVVEDGDLKEGDVITVTYGNRSHGGPGVNVPILPLNYWRNHKHKWWEHLVPLATSVDVAGTGVHVALPHTSIQPVQVKPAEFHHFSVFGPSTCVPDETVRFTVSAMDGYNNLLDCDLKALRIESHDFEAGDPPTPVSVPEFGTSATFKAKAKREGVVRMTVADTARGISSASNPMLCSRKDGGNLFWGEIHTHTAFSDGLHLPYESLRYARDVARMDFAATSDHDGFMTPSEWEQSIQAANELYEPGKFVTFIGYEWTDMVVDRDASGNETLRGCGEANVYTNRDSLPLYRVLDRHAQGKERLWKLLEEFGEDVIVIPHHPLPRMNWDHHNPFFERVVEIYSHWGDSEIRNNPRMINKQFGMSVQEILARKAHIGFVGGSDNHDGRPGLSGVNHRMCGAYDALEMKAGIMAVYADELTRQGILRALRSRRCYATTGERIILDFQVHGHPMGSEISAAQVNEKAGELKLAVRAIGTDTIAALELIRNNETIDRIMPDRLDIEHVFLDKTFGKTLEKERELYYYVRVIQRDDNRAWSSPIWITK